MTQALEREDTEAASAAKHEVQFIVFFIGCDDLLINSGLRHSP